MTVLYPHTSLAVPTTFRGRATSAGPTFSKTVSAVQPFSHDDLEAETMVESFKRPDGSAAVVKGSNYAAAVMALSPAVYWDMSGIDATHKGGIKDISGNGRDGSAQGGITIAGQAEAVNSPVKRDAYSTLFDNADDYVSSGYALFAAGAARSMACWAYRADVSGYHDLMATGGAFPGAVILQAASGLTDLVLYSGATGTPLTAVGAMPTAAWSHVAVTISASSNAIIYVNAQAVKSGAAEAVIASPGNFQAGAYGSGGNLWKGRLAHVAGWTSELTPNNVANLYSAGIG